MTPLPPPPPPPTRVRAHRPGDLTRGWRIVLVIAWVGVILALSAVWGATRQLGLSTWWLGSRSSPRPGAINLVPFVAPALALTALSFRVRRISMLSIAAGLGLAVVGIFDLDPYWTIGVAELAIAASIILVGIASLSGTYRRP